MMSEIVLHLKILEARGNEKITWKDLIIAKYLAEIAEDEKLL